MSVRASTQQETLIEKGVLASIFDDPDMMGVVNELLIPSDFNEPKHELIYSTALEFYGEHKSFDILKVAERLSNAGDLHKAGGVQYLSELVDPDTIYANQDPIGYALMVSETSRKRQLDLFGHSIAEKTYPGSGYDAESTIAFAQEELRRLSEISGSGELVLARDLLDEMFDDITTRGSLSDAATIGVPSGFIDFDKITGGFTGGQMIILGARPGVGKTTVALDMARASSLLAGKTTIFFSLEMSRKEVMQKILSAHAHIEFAKIKSGKLSDQEWAKLRACAADFQNANFLIDDTAELSINTLREKCIKQKNRPEGLDFIVIDYLQLMSVPNAGSDGRQVAIGNISRAVKLLAKELHTPILILSQLGRDIEKRADKTPMPSDLRDSGSLEQDADMVVFIDRREHYDPSASPGQAEIIIAKHRGGPTGTISVIPLLEFSKFANGAGKYAAEPPADSDVPPDTEDPFGTVQDIEDPYAAADYDDPYEAASEPDSGTPAW